VFGRRVIPRSTSDEGSRVRSSWLVGRDDKQAGCRQALENRRLQSFDGRVVDLSRRIE